ncbi:MAG: hypothetical protein J6Z80_04675, partial [Clostridia bacterium]|nr:hypothetical protein [Clostridia bacterium]
MKKTAQVMFALVMAAAILVSCAGGGKAGPDTAGGGGAGTQPGSVTENGGGESSPSGGLGAIGSAKPGETVYFGSWDQDGKDGGEPISWIVLYQGVGRTLVLSEKVLEYEYFKSPTDEDKFPRCLYKDSDLRAFLNGGFFDGAFSGDEKAAVPAMKITTGCKDESYRELTYETEDRVFLLSVEEAARYVCGVGTADLGVATERVGTDNPYGSSSISGVQGIDKAMTWWLRDMGVDNSKTARVVLADTNHRKNHDRNVYDKAGVRPAMWIVYNEKDAKAYENGEISPAEDASLNARISALKTGDRLQLGKYDKNPYNMDGYEDMFWTVVEEDDVSF